MTTMTRMALTNSLLLGQLDKAQMLQHIEQGQDTLVVASTESNDGSNAGNPNVVTRYATLAFELPPTPKAGNATTQGNTNEGVPKVPRMHHPEATSQPLSSSTMQMALLACTRGTTIQQLSTEFIWQEEAERNAT